MWGTRLGLSHTSIFPLFFFSSLSTSIDTSNRQTSKKRAGSKGLVAVVNQVMVPNSSSGSRSVGEGLCGGILDEGIDKDQGWPSQRCWAARVGAERVQWEKVATEGVATEMASLYLVCLAAGAARGPSRTLAVCPER